MAFLLMCLLVLSSSSLQALVVVAAASAAAAGGRPPAMFVFGDSTLDVGNNNYLAGPDVPRANKPYYGIDFPGSLPTGRFSNGYNIADYLGNYILYIYDSFESLFASLPASFSLCSNAYALHEYLDAFAAKSMGFASSPPPYLSLAPTSTARLVLTARDSGVSYASGGAGILDSTVRPPPFGRYFNMLYVSDRSNNIHSHRLNN